MVGDFPDGVKPSNILALTDLTIDEHGRPAPPLAAGELETLLGFLDFHRSTLGWKTRGLADEQLGLSLPPTTMTLGGLLKHLAFVEDYWFGCIVAEGEPHAPFDTADWDTDPDWEWSSAPDDAGEDLRDLWEDAVDRSRAIVTEELGEHGDDALDETYALGRDRVSLRWVLVHMIEEYARHNGHADLLREAVDGQTGE